MPTTENKNNRIEKSLAHLLRQLREAKISEAKWGSSAAPGHFEILNEGIKFLENIQFASVEDFGSVKELIEIEQFFKKSFILSNFYFPNYRAFVDSLFLTHAEIEVQLDTLGLKAHDLTGRGHYIAASKVENLILEFRNLNNLFFTEKEIKQYLVYRDRALQIINESRPILEEHRGYKQILGNLMLLILTAGTAFLVNKACTGHFLFFKTDSAKQINELSQVLSSYPIPQPSQ